MTGVTPKWGEKNISYPQGELPPPNIFFKLKIKVCIFYLQLLMWPFDLNFWSIRRRTMHVYAGNGDEILISVYGTQSFF